MPLKKQAGRISSARTAAKGSVKAKKVVSVSYGYGYSRKSGHGCGSGSKHGYGHKTSHGYGHGPEYGSGYGHGNGSCKKKTGYGYKKKSACKPVKPVCKPVKPVCRPVKPVCKPVKSVCRPVKPVCKPVKPVCRPVKPVCKPVKHFGQSCFKKVVRKSAFRANASQAQAIAAATLTQVAFNQEIFDLGREYNPATSTFRAKQGGVYTFFASVFYTAADPDAGPVEVTIVITVNGITAFGDTETLAFSSGVIDTSGIVNLRRGDDVQVRFIASSAGTISNNAGTHFDGALTRGNK